MIIEVDEILKCLFKEFTLFHIYLYTHTQRQEANEEMGERGETRACMLHKMGYKNWV